MTCLHSMHRLALLTSLLASSSLPSCGRVGFEGDLCRDIDCSGHGSCGLTTDGEPTCTCLPGYHNDGPLSCVPDLELCGSDLDCDDADPCTDDRCDPAGDCRHEFNQAPCDDGAFCTVGDRCDGAGRCAPGLARDCSSNDDCVLGRCDESADACVSEPMADGAECGPRYCDGLVWFRRTCSGGACTGAEAVEDCDDGEICTADGCDTDGCVHLAVADGMECGQRFCSGPELRRWTCRAGACTEELVLSCDDGDVCNGQELCVAGTCQPGSPLVCDDGQFCNGEEICHPTAGCQPGTPPCDDADPCLRCDEAVDTCLSPEGTDCDDGRFCNGPDSCDGAGRCVSSGDPCAGGDVCNDRCDEQTDTCTSPAGTDCDDGLFCNGADACDGAGHCVAGSSPCPAAGQCQECDEEADSCYSPAGAPCDDEDLCTHSDACDGGGTCAGTPVNCSCYADQCNAADCDPADGHCALSPLPIGTPCGPDGGRNPTYCSAGICTHWCNNSHELPGESDHECPAGYRCSAYSDTDSAGVCEPNSGGAGDIGDPCSDDADCRSESCDTTLIPARCVSVCSHLEDCRDTGPDTADWSCKVRDFGDVFTGHTQGLCNPSMGMGRTGSPCFSSSDCRDNYCDGWSHTCRDTCCTEAECSAPHICWHQAGRNGSFVKLCSSKGPHGLGAFGELCTASNYHDSACAAGLCLDMGDGVERCGRFCCRDADCPAGYLCGFAVKGGSVENVRACRLPSEHCCPNETPDQLEANDAGNNAVLWEWEPLRISHGPGTAEPTGLVLEPGNVYTIEGTGQDNHDDGPSSDYLDVDSFAFNSGSASDVHIVLDVAGTGANLGVMVTDTALHFVVSPGSLATGSADVFDGIYEEDVYADENHMFSPHTDYIVSIGTYIGSTGLPASWQLSLCAR